MTAVAAESIATERLTLEPLRADHAEGMFTGMADPALFVWLDDVPPPTASALQLRYQRVTAPGAGAPDRWLNWAMRRRDGGECAGLVEVTLRPDGVANLAYFTFTKFMRRGFAREACAAVLAALRDPFGAQEVVATMDVRNVASWRLVESLGFTRDRCTESSSVKGAPSVDFRYRLYL
ncbi:MAG: GNAT family N-acetyltransferase [Casimicrobiaceae bacterium]